MFKRKQSQRYNIYLGLFAILLISICPVITQTIALLQSSPHNSAVRQLPSSSHFECASDFYSQNHLNPTDFGDINDEPIFPNKTAHHQSEQHHNTVAKCGYCDLLHSFSILVAYNITVLKPTHSSKLVFSSDPFVLSLNYWSIRSRAPPLLTAV